MNYSLQNSKRLQAVGSVAAGSAGRTASRQPSAKWQQMLQTTLKSAFLQDDQEIWNLTFPFFFLSAACFISIKNTIWQKSYRRNQHPGLREELCPTNYSVLSTFLTGNFSVLSQLFTTTISKRRPEE